MKVGAVGDGCVDGGCTGVCLNWGPPGEKGFEVRRTWDQRKS